MSPWHENAFVWREGICRIIFNDIWDKKTPYYPSVDTFPQSALMIQNKVYIFNEP